MLTVEMLKEMEPGEIFARGEVENSPLGIYMINNNIRKLLRWVAVRGDIHDWTIYCHWNDKSYEWVKESGDKVYGDTHIKRLVPATDEAYKLYRR